MTVWCELDESGHPVSVWEQDMSAAGLKAYDLPEGVDSLGIGDYAWDGSEWVYDGAMSAARAEADAERERAEAASAQRDTAIALCLATTLAAMSDDDIASVSAYVRPWRENVEYHGKDSPTGKPQDVVESNGTAYRVIRDHTSQKGWEPENAPSLFAAVLPGQDGKVGPWEQPGSENGYLKGDRVTHEGHLWESIYDGKNIWEPGTSWGLWKDLGPYEGDES